MDNKPHKLALSFFGTSVAADGLVGISGRLNREYDLVGVILANEGGGPVTRAYEIYFSPDDDTSQGPDLSGINILPPESPQRGLSSINVSAVVAVPFRRRIPAGSFIKVWNAGTTTTSAIVVVILEEIEDD